MKSKIIVLFAKAWLMTDEVTKELREGVSIQYIMADNMNPVVNTDDNSLGIQVAKASIDIDKQQQIVEAPAIYDCEFILSTSGGKTILKPHSLEYVSSLPGVVEKKENK